MRKREIELLAPGGDVASIKAAILAGADAIYCGLDKFNARNRAENITLDELPGILRVAHANNCELFLTLNILIVESEIPALFGLLNKLVNMDIDGVIVQDLGLIYLLNHHFPTLKIHASTQLTTHNEGQIELLHRLSATRVNLSRELSLAEIRPLTATGRANRVQTEVFVHGSNCIAFSGLCYLSSVHGGSSGNRGRCSQPCRDPYLTTAAGIDYPLNIKDNSAYSDLLALAEAGVDSIKIEGRIKKYHYVYTVVETWRRQLQKFYHHGEVDRDDSDLYKVFNRSLSNAFLTGSIGRDLFIDNPRDNSAHHRYALNGGTTEQDLTTAKREVYEQKTAIIDNIKQQVEQLSIAKAPLTLSLSGQAGEPLQVAVITPDSHFIIHSTTELEPAGTHHAVSATSPNETRRTGQVLDHAVLLNRFKSINETAYHLEQVDLENLAADLFIPFKEITQLRDQVLFRLRGSRERLSAVEMPRLEKPSEASITPTLSLLIASRDDLHLCTESAAEVFLQLPNTLHHRLAEYVDLFRDNSRLIPWFPPVLIGKEYQAAVAFLEQLQPERIVTNNSGIAYQAYQRGIAWIAGPQMNLVNSFSLLCLKEYINCEGAFLSNEISRSQLKGIRNPGGLRLYYSIYHPILLMTSRVCLFHPVTGCKKQIVDDTCIQRCKRHATITNMKEDTLYIDKAKGGYHTIYNQTNFLNTAILEDLPNRFSSLFIDLREIKTDTHVAVDKVEMVRLFERLISGDPATASEIQQRIYPTTAQQYIKGI